MSRSIVLAPLLLLTAAHSYGAVTIQFQEDGSSVVATISGSIASFEGLSAPSVDGSFGTGSAVNSSVGRVVMGNNATGFLGNVYYGTMFSGQWVSSPANLGSTTAGFTPASSSSTNFAIWVNDYGITLTKTYSLGAEFIGTATWNNSSFNTLGLAEGIYTYSWTGDFINIQVGTPIPEPSTYGLILGGLALAGAAIRRRRKV